MKIELLKTACLLVVAAASMAAGAGSIQDEAPVEDVAYRVVRQLNADRRVTEEVKTIAFVKLFDEGGTNVHRELADLPVVFETSLLAVPGRLKFVVHSSHEEQWKMIDEIFRQARDMSSWDPGSCPQLRKLQLCDAILVGQILNRGFYEDVPAYFARMSFRLIKVSTGVQLWGGVVEGRYSGGGPDNERVSANWRKALESCAADAVAKLPQGLEGYGVVILPIEGQSGVAMEQVFLNALTAAGKQGRITVYDLPRGNVQDRMFARFLGDRGAAAARDQDFERRGLGQFLTARKLPEKLAVMSGMVSVVNENPKFQLDASGLPVDFLGGAAAVEAQQRKSYEIVCDFKFRDANDSFRLIGSVGAVGNYAPPSPPPPPLSTLERVRRFVHELWAFLGDSAVSRILKIALALIVLLGGRRMIRRIVSRASRPR